MGYSPIPKSDPAPSALAEHLLEELRGFEATYHTTVDDAEAIAAALARSLQPYETTSTRQGDTDWHTLIVTAKTTRDEPAAAATTEPSAAAVAGYSSQAGLATIQADARWGW